MSGRSQRHLREIYGVDSAGDTDVVVTPTVFDPNALLGTSVFGDFMRVSESVPAASAGLLTRWSGQRDATRLGPGASSATDDWGFDIGPYATAPEVGAHGPNGETCIRFFANFSSYCTFSQGGRGAPIGVGFGNPPFSANGLAPWPFGSAEAHTLGLRFRITGKANLNHGAGVFFGAGLVDNNSLELSLDSTNLRVNFSGTPLAHGFADGEWVTIVAVRNNVNTTVYKNGVLLGTLDLQGASLFRYFIGLWGAPDTTVDLTAYFMGLAVLDATQAADLSTWLEG